MPFYCFTTTIFIGTKLSTSGPVSNTKTGPNFVCYRFFEFTQKMTKEVMNASVVRLFISGHETQLHKPNTECRTMKPFVPWKRFDCFREPRLTCTLHIARCIMQQVNYANLSTSD